MELFEFTKDGYKKAKEYLISIGKENQIEKEQSTDGYTLVALANHYKELEVKKS